MKSRLVHTDPDTGFAVYRVGNVYRVDCGDLMAEFSAKKDMSRALRSARAFIETMKQQGKSHENT